MLTKVRRNIPYPQRMIFPPFLPIMRKLNFRSQKMLKLFMLLKLLLASTVPIVCQKQGLTVIHSFFLNI